VNNKEALTQALFLALTAPANRLNEAIDLAEELAGFCTLEQVAEAQQLALDKYDQFNG